MSVEIYTERLSLAAAAEAETGPGAEAPSGADAISAIDQAIYWLWVLYQPTRRDER